MTATISSNSKTKVIFTIGRYFRDKFGVKVYKTPISIMGFTCPNIDGTVAKGGCIYCENESFSPNLSKEHKAFKLNPHLIENPHLDKQLLQLESQYNRYKKRLAKKFGAKKFIVYFQSFTNTYAPFSTLKALYEKAFELPDAIGISIGTRSDCMSDKVLEFLRLKKYEGKEIWIEYGVQSAFDETLNIINRGHSFENAALWIKKTKEAGLNVCVHLIFGLPGETQEMMLKSVQSVIDLRVDAIKFHSLYITKQTKLAHDFKNGLFVPISEELYLDTLIKAIKMLPSNIALQRITAGVQDDTLLAPAWCYDSHTQKNRAKEALKKAGLEY
ncbi:MAG: TIGR01212 family radical SAM protein [Campylobacteraceae bacterium]|nr:TIGR01212 family radical SAM protein [Campylobacteraceae bacterium]